MSTKTRVIVVALIVLAFGALLVAKLGATRTVPLTDGEPVLYAPAAPGGPSESRSDADAAYEAARKTGKPIYLLFHSLTCVPCVEISAVVDKVIPEYEGKVIFVNAISDDEPSQRLAAKFKFQYIPTSFFIDSSGTIADAFTGAMDETAMRGYLDKLVSK